ncbi:MAG: cupin domain-containing protein [Ignavibacteria bacterium]
MEINKQKLTESIEYQDNSIVSKQIIKKPNGNVTLFAFDKGESLAEHTSPYEALVQILEGKMVVTIGGQPYILEEGDFILLPSDISHSLFAEEKSKMLLIMIKGG